MKLPNFEYRRARTMAEAVDLLNGSEDARMLAGGQSLMPLMALRLAAPARLVDISGCEELQGIAFRESSLTISAAVTTRQVELDEEIASRYPLLSHGVTLIGHPEIRNRGTICGSIAHADPAAELPAICVAVDADVRIIGRQGRRLVPAREFFAGPYQTSLEAGELIAGVELPYLDPDCGWSIQEFTRRHGDFALAGTVALLRLDRRTRKCTEAAVAVFGTGATGFHSSSAEAFLLDRELSPEVIAEAGAITAAEVPAAADIHGSEVFRRHVTNVVTRRALAEALKRATATEENKPHDKA